MDERVIEKRLQILLGLATKESVRMDSWEVRTGEHLGPNTYRYDGDWRRRPVPVEIPAGRTVFLQSRMTVPKEFPAADTFFLLNCEHLEGLSYIDGEPYCGTQIRARVPGYGRFKLSIEAQSVPEFFHNPGAADRVGRFTGGTVFVVDREIEGAYYDIKFAWDASRVAADERRKRLLGEAVEAALLAMDLTLPREVLVREVRAARRVLRQRLEAIAPDKEGGRVFLAGHTHIDTAWLWPIKETIRKCGRTFATSCRLMEEYPNYSFSCSQAQLYQYAKRYYPALYAEMKKWVKKGRWETTGAMWVEADCNAASGESLVRQILYGLRFYREEFGTRPRTCWLPDVFGYPASLPEILKGCGVEYFYTNKLHWQAQNPFPYHLFRWRGLDGSEVVAHIPKLLNYYNGIPEPEQLAFAWNNYLQKAEYPEVLLPYGYGDGGGGPNQIMLENVARARAFPGLPATRTGPSEAYFDDVARKKPELPVWDGELYLETHRGTYTTESETKRGNRKSEFALRDAEVFGVLARAAGGKFDDRTIRQAWETVLLDQFHDILPGSSIGEVYAETRRDYEAVRATAEKSIAGSLKAIAGEKGRSGGSAIAVFNSLGWNRSDPVEVVIPNVRGDICVCTDAGEPCPTQVVRRDRRMATVVFQPGEIPAMGYAVFRVCARKPGTESKISIGKNRLESPYYIMEWTNEGALSRLFDKRHRREVIPAGAKGNDLQLFQDGPEHEDAWNIHATYEKRRYAFAGPTRIEVIETGPVRAVVRVKRTHRNSAVSQDIIVYAGDPRIDFVTRVDWHERQTVLKVAFPVDIRARQATYEVQFGAVERPTHRNTSWDRSKFEVCGQRWVDVSEAGYGVSLLNDSRYGYDTRENVMRLTLLRGTVWPDRQADQGGHEFTYSLLPHAGDWRQGGTVRAAWELNVPARSAMVKRPAVTDAANSYLTIEGTAAVVETLKPADDGQGYILRLYEPHGGRGRVTVRCGWPVKKVIACNLVEEGRMAVPSEKGVFSFEFKPFEIRTFRLV